MWNMVGATVRGSSHEKYGEPCQDAHAWARLGNDTVLAVAADGAGSPQYPFSDVGASLAVSAVLETVLSQPFFPQKPEEWIVLGRAAFSSARKTIEIEAEARGCKPRQFATTLILAVAAPDFAISLQIGDGAVVAGYPFSLVTLPQRGEYANDTTFLTSPHALDAIQTGVWRGSAQSFAVFTDGVQSLALETSAGGKHLPFQPFFTPLFRFVSETGELEAHNQLEAFLRSSRVREEKTDDDLTLIACTRKEK